MPGELVNGTCLVKGICKVGRTDFDFFFLLEASLYADAFGSAEAELAGGVGSGGGGGGGAAATGAAALGDEKHI